MDDDPVEYSQTQDGDYEMCFVKVEIAEKDPRAAAHPDTVPTGCQLLANLGERASYKAQMSARITLATVGQPSRPASCSQSHMSRSGTTLSNLLVPTAVLSNMLCSCYE